MIRYISSLFFDFCTNDSQFVNTQSTAYGSLETCSFLTGRAYDSHVVATILQKLKVNVLGIVEYGLKLCPRVCSLDVLDFCYANKLFAGLDIITVKNNRISMFIMIFVDDSIDVANIYLSLYNVAIFILEIFARSKLVCGRMAFRIG